MSVRIITAYLKVYASANLHKKACEVYLRFIADGLEPDKMLYNLIWACAVESGDDEMTKVLGPDSSNPDGHGKPFAGAIRACLKDKDVVKALNLLDQAIK